MEIIGIGGDRQNRSQEIQTRRLLLRVLYASQWCNFSFFAGGEGDESEELSMARGRGWTLYGHPRRSICAGNICGWMRCGIVVRIER